MDERTMRETERRFKWFWAWNDEEEEAWLSEMAEQGLHLQAPGFFGVYTFERGAPRHVTYRLDFKAAGKDIESYLQLFSDAGWEHVGTMGGWQYFRKATPEGERPQIYTDTASKITKYQRVLSFLVIFLPIYIVTLTQINDSPSPLIQAVSFVSALFMLLYVYAMVRIFIRISQLKK